jgi:hypothetical protein
MSDADDDEIDFIHAEEVEYELAGTGVPVVGKRATPDECEKADVLICAPVAWGSMFTDSLIAACSQCNQPIQYRPYAPTKPPKLCVPCAGLLLRKAQGHA